MRLNTGESGNVEDRRGMGPMAVGGGLGAVVLTILGLIFGVNLNGGTGSGSDPNAGAPATQQAPASAHDDAMGHFVRQVLRSTEVTWADVFQQTGRQYQDPTLVMYSGATQSACGLGQAAMGPFYCPRDEKVYIDLSFYNDLQERFHAPGEFAEAYVVAHEVGHHVQNLLGISQQVEQAQQAAGSKAEANRYSVRLELQADCFAGVWAYHANQEGSITLEPGDAESAIRAATAIGDDRLQKESQGYVVPDSFTHGSSAERVRWLTRGLQTGDMKQCDTFSARSLDEG
jgi:predicted metalloprotease